MQSRNNVQPLQGDVIRQWEIAAMYHLDDARDMIALDFKKRLENGAKVEAGEYSLEENDETASDVREQISDAGGGAFNCAGFESVAWRPRRARRKIA